jgi:hypothetical protein
MLRNPNKENKNITKIYRAPANLKEVFDTSPLIARIRYPLNITYMPKTKPRNILRNEYIIVVPLRA